MSEPESIESVQRWMALDLWMALGNDSQAFGPWVARFGWADTWSLLLANVRSVLASAGATGGTGAGGAGMAAARGGGAATPAPAGGSGSNGLQSASGAGGGGGG